MPASPLDRTWGVNGIATAATGFGHVRELLVAPDGKVVSAGSSSDRTDGRLVVARFTADGAPDPTFRGAGFVMTDLPNGAVGGATAAAMQPDGRVIAVGRAGVPGRFGVVRYADDGTLDPSFSADGMVVTSFAGLSAQPTAVTVLADGRIVVAGTSDSAVLIARYNPDGRIDRSFGAEGRVVTDLPGVGDQATAVAGDADGNLIVAALARDPDTSADTIVARYLSYGRLDPSFGTAGIVVNDFGAGFDMPMVIALQPDGGILTGGIASLPNGVTTLSVARYLPDGHLDPTFSVDGRTTVALTTSVTDSQTGLVPLPDGRIAVAGTTRVEGSSHTVVAMLNPDGSPDTSFGTDGGIVAVPLAPSNGFELGAMLARQDDHLVVATAFGSSTERARTLAIGRLPTTIPVALVGVTLAASPNPAGPGRVGFVATVANAGPAPADNVIVALDVSKSIGPVVVSQGKSQPGPRAGTATCSLGRIDPGGRATVSTSTTVNGFEEGLFATAKVTTATLDPDRTDNTTTIEVFVTREVTI